MQKLLVFKMKLPKFKNSWGYENNFYVKIDFPNNSEKKILLDVSHKESELMFLKD